MTEKDIVVRFHRAMARIFAGAASEAQLKKFKGSIMSEYDKVMLQCIRSSKAEADRLLDLGRDAFWKERKRILG